MGAQVWVIALLGPEHCILCAEQKAVSTDSQVLGRKPSVGCRAANAFPSASLPTQHSLQSDHVCASNLKGSQDRQPPASAPGQPRRGARCLPFNPWSVLRKQGWMFLDFLSSVTPSPGINVLVLPEKSQIGDKSGK